MSLAYKRVIELLVGNVSIKASELTLGFDVPFRDNAEPNESRIDLYNLSDNSINAIAQFDSKIIVNAGYAGDVGTILEGRLVDLETFWDGPDKRTSIIVLDSESLKGRTIESKAYKKQTSASTVLRDLISTANLQIGEWSLQKDIKYEEGITVEGSVTEAIKKIAEDCETPFYINKGRLFLRPHNSGDKTNFILSPRTGLIGSPQLFVSEGEQGYRAKSLLQHRITTSSLITIQSKVVQGSLRVARGRHVYDGNNFVTEMEAVFNG
nr:hypothetical protein [Brevibacillus laterosporus]